MKEGKPIYPKLIPDEKYAEILLDIIRKYRLRPYNTTWQDLYPDFKPEYIEAGKELKRILSR